MVDLKKLEKNLDEALSKETKKSLNDWLNNQRMESKATRCTSSPAKRRDR